MVKDTEFFEKALGLKSPWKVKEVKMDLEGKEVEVVIECQRGTIWAESGERLHIHSWEQRKWRHLDTMQMTTVLRAEVPRVKAADGSTQMVKVPWAGERSRWTLAFEALAISVLQNARSITQAASLLGLDWKSARAIMGRAVERGLGRRDGQPLRVVSIDEKSFGRGQDYVSVLSDPAGRRVLEVVAGRTQNDAEILFDSLSREQRTGIAAVVMDMSAAYEAAARTRLPRAEVVFDRFHIAALMGKAVDEVRRKEHRRLMEEGDESLKNTKFLWLFHPDNLGEERLLRFEELVELNLATVEAYYHRLQLLEFWQQPDATRASAHFESWASEALACSLEPIARTARTLKEHFAGLISWFRHRATNAAAEAFNGRIQAIKANARGFRAFAHYRTAILFHLGRLDLMPI
jgi:transposase